MEFSGPDSIDKAIKNGLDLDGSPIPSKMLKLYREVMDKENSRQRSGVKKSMRNRIVKTGSKHFDQDTLNTRLIKAGWDGLKAKEIDFFYNWDLIRENISNLPSDTSVTLFLVSSSCERKSPSLDL